MMGITSAKAIENAEAMKALGQTRVYLSEHDEPSDGFPWEHVTSVEKGSTASYIGPRSIGFTAKHPCGLEFYWSLDLSPTGGLGVDRRPFFDHTAIADMLERLPEPKRADFAAVIANEVLPPLREQIKDARAHLLALTEGENTLLGISTRGPTVGAK